MLAALTELALIHQIFHKVFLPVLNVLELKEKKGWN
jgi:hypothetical protein